MNTILLTITLLTMSVLGRCIANDEDPLIFSTNECYLTEPVYEQKFNFSALHSDLAKVAISANGDKFEYNICGNLSGTCDGKNNAAACLKRGDKEYVLGTQHRLHYHRGKIYFEFSNGSKCPRGNGELKLFVFLSCDYTLDRIQSQVTQYADDECKFYITLETPYACLPEPIHSNGCSVQDPNNGHNYDLLSLSDYNYRTIDRRGNAFVINICKPVLYGENAMCPIGSSVCFIQLNATDYKKRFFDYGSVQPNPVIENGQLLMRLTSTTMCNGTDNYSSTIRFMCDKTKKSAQLSLVGINGCVFEFSFTTPLACNNYPPCTTITHGNEMLDMRPLKDKRYNLTIFSKTYAFGICSNAGQPCMDNDGACLHQDQQTTSIGQYNTQLRFNHSGSPYLLYTDGAPCNGQTKWSTKIEFVCTNNATKDNGSKYNNNNNNNNNTSITIGPKIIENKDCQLLIHFQTPLACQEQITCKVKVYVEHSEDGTGEELVDLTPLISITDNYEAKINIASITEQQVPKSTKFFLNVCRPLVPKFGLGCPGGSAACMAKVDPTSSPTPEEEKSLGFPIASLVAYNRTNAELRYMQGSPCPTDNKSQLSSGIEFYCDMRVGVGTPILQTITDCHYQFQWATNVICPSHMCNFNEDTCEIMNDDINVSYNLKKAPFTENGKIKIPNGKAEFTLDFCDTHAKAETDYSQGLVNLFFSADAPCGKSGVQLRLTCSEDNSRDINYSNSGKECNLVIVQRTPDICKFLGLVIPPTAHGNSDSGSNETTTATTEPPTNSSSNATNTPQAGSDNNNSNNEKNDESNSGGNHPAEQTSSIGAILAAILSLTCFAACVGVFVFMPNRRNGVRRLLRRSTSAVRYSRVQSNEEANLLLEPNGEFTESDDDMLL